MNKYLLFFAALLFPALVWAETGKQPLQIVPKTQLFPVLTTAVGSFEVLYPFIRVGFDTLTIRNDSKNFQRVIGLRVGLAQTTANGGWDVVRWSDYFVTDRDLLAGRTLALSNLSTYIPIDGFNSLQPFWLIVATYITGSENGRIATSATYSHSPEGIFKNPILPNTTLNASPVLLKKPFQLNQ